MMWHWLNSAATYLSCMLQMSGSRMKIAGRFKLCAHMGCFDLEVFVEMNQRSRKASKFINPQDFFGFPIYTHINPEILFSFGLIAVAMPYLSQELCFGEYHY